MSIIEKLKETRLQVRISLKDHGKDLRGQGRIDSLDDIDSRLGLGVLLPWPLLRVPLLRFGFGAFDLFVALLQRFELVLLHGSRAK